MFTTYKTRENNPKAVFVGDQTPLITDIAQYLNERDVELFSGKNLSDAFFGNYFFYIGKESDVKSFLEKAENKPPKSLLIMPIISGELQKFLENNYLNQIKILLINKNLAPTAEIVEQIIDFFFTDLNRTLDLTSLMPIDRAELKKENLAPKIATPEVEQVIKENTEEISLREKINETPGIVIESPQIQIEKDIQSLHKKQAVEKNQNNKFPVTKNKQRSFFSKIATTIFLALLVLTIIFLGEIIITFLLLSTLRTQDFKNPNLLKTKTNILKFVSSNALSQWRTMMPLWEVVKQRELGEGVESVLDISSHVSQVSDMSVDAINDLSLVWKQVLSGEQNNNLNETLSRLKTNITLIDMELAFIEAKIKSSQALIICQKQVVGLNNLCKNGQEKISTIRQFTIKAKQIFPLLPDAIGLNGPRKYMVILQNNMELRPTGGFIGAFAIISFDAGVLKNVELSDVYSADGQLKGHIDPPLPIRTYLGQEHWYMRDANWNPDFTKTGEQLAWFLDKEINVSVDGVWAVDLTLAKSIIGVLGEINLPDFSEKITADNLFIKTHENTNQDFFPGSTQKKDFLSSLFKSMMGEITAQKNISNWDIVQVLFQSFQQKHLQIFFTNSAFEQVIKDIGWAGEMKNTDCGINCFSDYLSLIDANLGVNKTNYYVEKNIEDKIYFQKNTIQHAMTIKYKNNSPISDEKIGGVYKDYLRIYLPKDAQIVETNLNNQLLKISTDPIATKSAVLQAESGNLISVGVLIDVRPETEASLTLVYTQPLIVSNNPFTYQLSLIKQAGTQADKVSLNFNYPETWNFKPINIGQSNSGQLTLVKNGEVTYNTNLLQNQIINWEIESK